MPEVQKHGFFFEEWIKKILKVDKVESQYTQKWDVPGKIPVSIKCMGLTNALEFGSAVRIWEIDQPFILIIGRWEQKRDNKIIKSIDEINVTLDKLEKMKGNISLQELKIFDEKIKKFPAGKKGQKEAIEFAKDWTLKRKNKMGLLTITRKIDSKNQRRIQCNLNYKKYLKLFGEPSFETTFRGKNFNQEINHGARVFNNKN